MADDRQSSSSQAASSSTPSSATQPSLSSPSSAATPATSPSLFSKRQRKWAVVGLCLGLLLLLLNSTLLSSSESPFQLRGSSLFGKKASKSILQFLANALDEESAAWLEANERSGSNAAWGGSGARPTDGGFQSNLLYNYTKREPLPLSKGDEPGLAPLTRRVQQWLFRWQNRPAYKCRRAKYAVAGTGWFSKSGLGFNVQVLTSILGQAISQERILLLPKTGGSHYAAGNPHCGNITNWECFFLPFSNCSSFARRNSTVMIPPNKTHLPVPVMAMLEAEMPSMAQDSMWFLKRFWWRSQGTAYLSRLNGGTLQLIRQQRKDWRLHRLYDTVSRANWWQMMPDWRERQEGEQEEGEAGGGPGAAAALAEQLVGGMVKEEIVAVRGGTASGGKRKPSLPEGVEEARRRRRRRRMQTVAVQKAATGPLATAGGVRAEAVAGGAGGGMEAGSHGQLSLGEQEDWQERAGGEEWLGEQEEEEEMAASLQEEWLFSAEAEAEAEAEEEDVPDPLFDLMLQAMQSPVLQQLLPVQGRASSEDAPSGSAATAGPSHAADDPSDTLSAWASLEDMLADSEALRWMEEEEESKQAAEEGQEEGAEAAADSPEAEAEQVPSPENAPLLPTAAAAAAAAAGTAPLSPLQARSLEDSDAYAAAKAALYNPKSNIFQAQVSHIEYEEEGEEEGDSSNGGGGIEGMGSEESSSEDLAEDGSSSNSGTFSSSSSSGSGSSDLIEGGGEKGSNNEPPRRRRRRPSAEQLARRKAAKEVAAAAAEAAAAREAAERATVRAAVEAAAVRTGPEAVIPYPLPKGCIYVFVRNGDKKQEMHIPTLEEVKEAAILMLGSHPLHLRPTLVVGTDNDTALRELEDIMPEPWQVWSLTIPRNDSAMNFNQLSMTQALGPDIVHLQLLQLLLALEADALICTLNSNVCKLLKQWRCTWVAKCNQPYVDLNPYSNWRTYTWRRRRRRLLLGEEGQQAAGNTAEAEEAGGEQFSEEGPQEGTAAGLQVFTRETLPRYPAERRGAARL